MVATVVGSLFTIVVFGVYLCTMYPSVPGGDSGELIVAGCTAGIAHPPGQYRSHIVGEFRTVDGIDSVNLVFHRVSALHNVGSSVPQTALWFSSLESESSFCCFICCRFLFPFHDNFEVGPLACLQLTH